MGSGTAVSVAIIRALSNYLGAVPDDELVSNLAYEVERLYHGTPSGIDNTVVTWNRPVYFSRDRSVQTLKIKTPFDLLIADTGIPSPTKTTVADVRSRWQNRPGHYEELFERIGQVTKAARAAIESGQVDELGPLMARNQVLLEQLGVSCPELESLAQAGLAAGAGGAKLSGGGRGGHLVVLARPEASAAVRQALLRAGALSVISTVVM
jgi:mevalonate kinase